MKDINIKIFDFGIVINTDDKSSFYSINDLKSIADHYRNFNFNGYKLVEISKLELAGIPIYNSNKLNNSIDRAYSYIRDIFSEILPCNTNLIGLRNLDKEISRLPKFIGKNRIWEGL